MQQPKLPLSVCDIDPESFVVAENDLTLGVVTV